MIQLPAAMDLGQILGHSSPCHAEFGCAGISAFRSTVLNSCTGEVLLGRRASSRQKPEIEEGSGSKVFRNQSALNPSSLENLKPCKPYHSLKTLKR